MLERLVSLLPLVGAGGAMEVPDWTAWAYVYGVGGVVFAVGLVVCVATRQIDLSAKRGRRAMALMVAGFVGYAILQGVMQMALPRW